MTTCTEPGWDAYDTCENCDYTTYHEIPATGHHLVHHEGKAATETESGWEPYDECTECGYSTYKVIPALNDPLTLDASLDDSEPMLGTKVRITASAQGGTQPYSYSFYYKKASANNWRASGTPFTDETTASVKLKNLGDYIFKIAVKDSSGGMVSTNFDVTITDTPTAELKNTSKVSSQTIAAGTRLYLTGSAEGGEAPCTYSYYYKRSTSGKWNAISENTAEQTASIRLNNVGTYDLRVVVTDGSSAKDEKSFTVTVS